MFFPKCSLCSEDGNVSCCKKLFCEVCISEHIMKITEIRHKPIPLNLDREDSLIKLIQNRLNNEILALNEFKISFEQVVEGFGTSLKKEIDDYTSQMLKKFSKIYQDAFSEIQTALSCLFTHGIKNDILELFAGCSNAEDIKNIDVITKSIISPIFSIGEQLSDSVKFELVLKSSNFNTAISRNTINSSLKNNSQYQHIFINSNEHQVKVSRSMTTFDGSANNKFRVIGFLRPINETLYFPEPFSNKILSFSIKDSVINESTFENQRFPNKPAWSMSKNGKLIITGGFDESAKKSCLEVSINEKKCEELPKMNTARFNHAQITVDNSIFVIGGMQKVALNECERFCFDKRRWVKFCNLNVSREFPAAAHLLGKIFVAGGTGIETIEYTYINKAKFEMLMIRLPGPGKCNMFPKEGHILILHKGKQIMIMQPNMNYKLVGDTDNGNFWTNSEYIVYEKNIYWVGSGEFLSFDIETGRIKKI